MKPIHYSSLYTERIVFSVCLGRETPPLLPPWILTSSSFTSSYTDILAAQTLTFTLLLFKVSSLTFFFSASLYICHVCLLPLALFLIIACFPVLLDQLLKVSVLCTAERGASWKRQAVRMTSSCRKAFYVSLCVLTLSIALLTSACQLRSLCDIMIK